MSVIHIGDGRYINVKEGVLHVPPPDVKKKAHVLTDEERYRNTKKVVLAKRGENHHHLRWEQRVSGYWEFMQRMREHAYKYGRMGQEAGIYHHIPPSARNRVKRKVARQVERDMENIKKVLDVDDMAEEALRSTLEVLRGPVQAKDKLAAARLLLEYTKSKPVAKSEVSVNAAEQWLASLATDNDT